MYHKMSFAIYFNLDQSKILLSGNGLRTRPHLHTEEMNRGIRMLDAGLFQQHVAAILGVYQSTIARMWVQF